MPPVGEVTKIVATDNEVKGAGRMRGGEVVKSTESIRRTRKSKLDIAGVQAGIVGDGRPENLQPLVLGTGGRACLEGIAGSDDQPCLGTRRGIDEVAGDSEMSDVDRVKGSEEESGRLRIHGKRELRFKEKVRDDTLDIATSIGEIIVNDRHVEAWGVLHLVMGFREASFDSLGGLGRAEREAFAERVNGRSLYKNRERARTENLLEASAPDDIDIKEGSMAGSPQTVDLIARSTVITPIIHLLPLKKVPGGSTPAKLIGREKIIIAPVLLLATR
jgi:hypothetical protein